MQITNYKLRVANWLRVPTRTRSCSFLRAIGILLFSSFLIHHSSLPARAQNVSIGTAVANNSALLHLESTTQGLLIPRMTSTQMNAISLPATGDLIYNTTSNNFYYYNGTIWTAIIGSGWSITGDGGTSASTNFLGTTDSVDLVQRTNSHERMRVYGGGNIGLTNTLNSAEKLIFYEPSGLGTLYTAFKAGAQDSTIHYTWPPSDGTDGQALDDSVGTLGWKTLESVGGGFGDTLWARGSASYELYSLGTNNAKQGKYSIVSTIDCSSSNDACSIFGDSNSSSAKYGCIAGGSNNSVSGQGGSVVRGGARNSAGSQNTMIVGGLGNTTTGANGVVLGGDSNLAHGVSGVVINGSNNTASAQNNLVFGANITTSAGGNQLIFYPPTSPGIRTGIQNTSPAEAMDVGGNVRFSGALKPNGAVGTSGNYLLSAGTASPPTWSAPPTLPLTNNWGLLGNAGSNPPTNYIGTTDATAFVMRTYATERARILSSTSGFVGVGTSSPTHQLHVVSSSTTDETAAVFGVATGSTTLQSVGVWGRADNTSTSNTGSISVLATGNGSGSAGSTNVALQLNQGELAMGRTTKAVPIGSPTSEPATSGFLYSQEGPSGVIDISLASLTAAIPVSGVYVDLGTITINNEYITSSSIILANVVGKYNSGGGANPKNSVFRIDVESRSAGSCVVRIGMIPFATDTKSYNPNDDIRIGYAVINPGR